MSQIQLNDRIIPRQDMIESKIDGDLVMMNLELEHYFGLNSVGTAIWEMLPKQPTFNSLIEQLMLKFEIDHDTCVKETSDFITLLENQKLISIEKAY